MAQTPEDTLTEYEASLRLLKGDAELQAAARWDAVWPTRVELAKAFELIVRVLHKWCNGPTNAAAQCNFAARAAFCTAYTFEIVRKWSNDALEAVADLQLWKMHHGRAPAPAQLSRACDLARKALADYEGAERLLNSVR